MEKYIPDEEKIEKNETTEGKSVNTVDLIHGIIKEDKEKTEKKTNTISRLKDGWKRLKENFKESVKENTKRAIILSSIAFTMLSASEGMALTNKDFSEMFEKEQQTQTLVLGHERLQELEEEKYEKLFRHADELNQTIEPERITSEFNLLNSVSEVLNNELKSETNKNDSFDFANRAYNQIERMNENLDRIMGCSKEEKKQQGIKILEAGRVNWQGLIKTFPLVYGLQTPVLISHELGHLKEASQQGAKAEGISVSLGFKMGGFASYDNESGVKNPELISAAGINASERLSDFIINALKKGDQNNQVLALMALIGKLDSSQYVIRTQLGMFDDPKNDIKNYSDETGVSVDELTTGLLGNFIINSDNWTLVKMALGDESVKFSDKFWECYYEMEKGGPEIGVKAGIRF